MHEVNHRDMADDEFQAKMAQAMSSCQNQEGSDGFKMTKDEGDRIAQCFKEPEFKELFHEYLDEMSDPKNREEMDTYIRQLEKEDNVPEGMCIPSEGLCAKCWLKSATTKSGKGSKVFINITHSKEVQPASSRTATDANGKKGTSWSIPFVIAPQPKMVEDHTGERCNSWDVCVNTTTFDTQVAKNKSFCDMVLSTAMVDIREKFEVPINDKEYKVLKNKKYMGGKPVPMNLKGTEPAGGVPVAPQATTKEDGTKSGGGSTQPEESPGAKRGGVQKGFMNKKKKKDGPAVPKYTVVHRGQAVIQDCWQDGGLQDAVANMYSSRPKELLVRIELSQLDHARDVELDIAERTLVLDVGEEATPGHMYHLEATLPYPVDPDGEGSSARFDKQKRQLVVTLPVQPPDEEEVKLFQEAEKQRRALLEESELLVDESGVHEVTQEAASVALVEEVEQDSAAAEEAEGAAEAENQSERERRASAELEQSSQIAAEMARRQKGDAPVCRVPQWEFVDSRRDCQVVVAMDGILEGSVQAHFAKEGLVLDFLTKAPCKERFSLVVQTYAPVVPGWCRAKWAPEKLTLTLTKAKPGPWACVGQLCGAEAAGLGTEAAGVEQERSAPVEAVVEVAAALDPVETIGETGSSEGHEDEPFKPKKLLFIPASSFEGFKNGYVFQMGAQGLGYYQDVDPLCKIDSAAIEFPEEVNNEPQTKWDWVQEARAGGASSEPVKSKNLKPAFKRGFIDDAASKNEELLALQSEDDGFVMPGLDGDSDEDEEDAPAQNGVDVPWAPSISLQTRAFLTTLD